MRIIHAILRSGSLPDGVIIIEADKRDDALKICHYLTMRGRWFVQEEQEGYHQFIIGEEVNLDHMRKYGCRFKVGWMT